MSDVDYWDRFWSKVNILDPDECWNWKAFTKPNNGYGTFRVGGRSGNTVLAHRVAYELINGTIPPNMCVLHSCDNPTCCNPKHLHLGTQLDNIAERQERNRQDAVLTETDVLEIRNKYNSGDYLQLELAQMYGVTKSNISAIVCRRSWRNI